MKPMLIKSLTIVSLLIGATAVSPVVAFAGQTQTSSSGTNVGASGNGSGGNGNGTGNGNGSTNTDGGKGNGGVNNGNGDGGGASVPEAPYAVLFPLALAGAALYVYRKNRKAV